MEKGSRHDLLSDLPLSIIHSILTFVPIRDAVKTSILLRQWRYKWATLPHLVFDVDCATKGTSLNHFVTQALFLHKGPVHKFELSSFETCFIDQCLLFLSRNDIRMLIISSYKPGHQFQIHSSIYSCENLTHLELWNCEIPPSPPTFNGFLWLRSLALTHVEVPCKAIESIVADSPLLEEVTLHSNKYSGSLEWRIRAPNLKDFYVNGVYIEIFLYAPLLSKLSLILHTREFTAERLQQRSSVCNYINFLGGFTNLEELRVARNFIKFLSIGVESCHRSLVFHHLRVIFIQSVSFNDIKDIWVVVRLIMSAPNLHKLQITCGCYVFERTPDVASISFWDSENATNIRFERLKEIEMWNGHVVLNEIKLVKFLLASSPVLETLSFQSSSRLVDDRMLVNLRTELLSYLRASTNAQISVR